MTLIRDPDVLSAVAVPVGQKIALQPLSIPDGCKKATLRFNSQWHTDPDSIAVWGVEISEDGGTSWHLWATATRPGGNILDEFGSAVTEFDVTIEADPGFSQAKGALFRPFIGVLKGTSSTTAFDIDGTFDFQL